MSETPTKESKTPRLQKLLEKCPSHLELLLFAEQLEIQLKQSERKARALDWIERNHPRITSWKLRSTEFPGWHWLIQQLDDEKMVARSIENQESLLSAIEAAISQGGKK